MITLLASSCSVKVTNEPFVNGFTSNLEVSVVADYDEQVLPKEEGETEESPGEFNREQVSSKSADTAKNLSNKDKKIIQLKSELDEAISKEDYEKAAQIRDELKKMEISNLN